MHPIKPSLRVAKLYLMDTSGSMAEQGKIDMLKKVLVDLLASGRYYEQDLVALWSFNSGCREHLPLTPVRSVGSRWVRAVHAMSPWGGTAMATALERALGALVAVRGFKKTIVLLSDGMPTQPRAAVLSRIDAARRERVRISTIGFGTAREIDIPLLQQLARATGGRYAHAAALAQLAAALRAA